MRSERVTCPISCIMLSIQANSFHMDFEGKKFSVENCLSLFACSYVIMPAFSLYDQEKVDEFRKAVPKCHVYFIGLVPVIKTTRVKISDTTLETVHALGGKEYTIDWGCPPDLNLDLTTEQSLSELQVAELLPDEERLVKRLSEEFNAITFEVLYIGQSLGKDGSRNAFDRLLHHETLQKIAVQGFPSNFQLYVLLIEISAQTQLIAHINPKAKNKTDTLSRFSLGWEKVKNTSEAERTALYEASMIRYFKPKYNKEFKNSFPSTNLKILSDCYDKDFVGIVAEFDFGNIPMKLFSECVAPSPVHVAKHHFTGDYDRQMFFLEDSWYSHDPECF